MRMIVERKEIMNIMNDTGKGATALRASLGFPLYVKPRSLRGPSQSLVRNSRGNAQNQAGWVAPTARRQALRLVAEGLLP